MSRSWNVFFVILLEGMRRGLFILFFVAFTSIVYSQGKTKVSIKHSKIPPKKTDLILGVGYAQSVLFLERNIKKSNDAKGLNFHLIYGGNGAMRSSFEYTYYQPINIEPTWFNIKASTIEWNGHLLARDSNSVFYLIFGLSYNRFQGYFTGVDDFLFLSEKYSNNSTVRTNWAGLNIGCGYERIITGPVRVFLDYKMRVGIHNGRGYVLNIMDVCISAGARFALKVPSGYSIRRYFITGSRSRYLLDKE